VEEEQLTQIPAVKLAEKIAAKWEEKQMPQETLEDLMREGLEISDILSYEKKEYLY
jgi:hypothetical protein